MRHDFVCTTLICYLNFFYQIDIIDDVGPGNLTDIERAPGRGLEIVNKTASVPGNPPTPSAQINNFGHELNKKNSYCTLRD